MPDQTTLGVLMLDTRFPRLEGDIGNPASVDLPVLYHLIEGADVSRIVLREEVDPRLLGPFVEGTRWLERHGVAAITTSCGFLSVFQDRLAAAVSIPVVSSSLLLVPFLARLYRPDRRIGIVTANAATLSEAHLSAAGITSPIVIGGIEQGQELPKVLLRPKQEQAETIDLAAAEADVVAAGRAMLSRDPAICAFVLECTNLQPYAAALGRATGRPVFGLLDALRLICPAIRPRP